MYKSYDLNSSTHTQQGAVSARLTALIDQILDARLPGDIDITTDGKRAAFVVWEPLPGQQLPRGRIWVADAESGNARPLSDGKQETSCPRWSPDGTRLAFLSKAEGEKERPQLHLMKAEGSDAQPLCRMPNGASALAWAPDGSRIAFISVEGEEPKRDPLVLAPARHRRLWTVRPDHAIAEAVTPPDMSVWEHVWSPDSTQLALYYSPGSDDTDWYSSQIGVVPAEGGAVRQVSDLTWQARSLAWSPDGRQIAYLSGRWSDPGRGSGDIFTVSLERTETRNLTQNIDCSPAWCCWFPDGRYLLFTAIRQVTHQICMVDSFDGTIIVLEEDFVMHRDQPTLAITPDRGSFATVHSTAQQPPDVWHGTFIYKNERPMGVEWKRLTHLNPIIEATIKMPKSERISYASVDGWSIDGVFSPALNVQEGQLPPLYVEVHGGPSGAYCDNWFHFTSIYAAAGFAVFRPNMRGSWGHGAAFADAVLGDMGGKDLQDILNGVEDLVQRGKVDGNRVCIGGWSNGGFLSAWAVTQTTRFKAAMVGAGITDWHGMHAQSNIADADMLLLEADPLKQPDIYREHSPITFAEWVTTPTLILHGEDDPAVPVAQAYTFYRALRERGVPVECVIYPREGHGLSERDHNRDSIERVLRWFTKYVQ